MGRPGRTPSVVREAFRGPLIAGSDHIPCHRPRKGRKLRRVSDACLPRWLALERNRTPRDHKSLARMGCELLHRASAHTLRWIQTSCKCVQSSACRQQFSPRAHCRCSRLPCRLCSALSFLALHREVSSKALLFLHGPYICWLCGLVCLAARSRGFSGAVSVRVLHFLCSGQLVNWHRGRADKPIGGAGRRRPASRASRGRGRGAGPCIGG